MELLLKRQCDGYTTTIPIDTIDNELMEESRLTFEDYKRRGVIVEGEYEDQIWVLSDEVRKRVSFSFAINEVHNNLSDLSLDVDQAEILLRVYVTSLFGFSLPSIQSALKCVRTFIGMGNIPEDSGNRSSLISFLQLCPTTPKVDALIEKVLLIQEKKAPEMEHKRSLCFYSSYVRFSDVINSFWETATREERLLYFPIWFWWAVTSIIPLRATEVVLTPRHCVKTEDGKYYLQLRRTKLKGSLQNTHYKIDKDYELCTYRVTAELAKEISWYINETETIYCNDIDTLFCKATQFALGKVAHESDSHYSYANLRSLLYRFYEDVVKKRFAITRDPLNLSDNEIQLLKLGDARHVAMVSLILQGSSPIICRELARHSTVNMSAYYYSNLAHFIDVIGDYAFIPNPIVQDRSAIKAAIMSSTQLTPVAHGFCLSENYACNSYQDCQHAIDHEGHIGLCSVCTFFLDQNGSQNMLQHTKNNLQKTNVLLRDVINKVREGKKNEEEIGCLIERFRSEAFLYATISATEKKLHEERGLLI